MAYLAMARKWRPRNFEEMVGQDHIAQTIRNAIEGKRISHAYLFTGTRGVGKTTSARILAKALNCARGPAAIPCETCANCQAVSQGNSMDVLEIDGASNNSVDNIRDLREQVKYAPMHGSYKIYIIDEVHMLSKAAFNALLKTLEEPPPHVVFIFATTEAGKVPHTILSRVQRFDFKRISEAHIRQRLEFICSQEAIVPEREALEAIARKADGSMRDALSLFDQVYAFSGAALTMEAARKVLGIPREGLFDALLEGMVRHDQKACFAIVQDAHREGIETAEFLVSYGEYLRNLLFARQGVGASALGLGEARHAEISAMAPELKDGDVIRLAKMVSDLLASLKSAANPRLAVELGFARMAALDRVVTLSQLLGQDFALAAPAPATDAAPARPPAGIANPPARPEEPAGMGEASATGGAPGSGIGRGDFPEAKKKSPLEPAPVAGLSRPAPEPSFPPPHAAPAVPLPSAARAAVALAPSPVKHGGLGYAQAPDPLDAREPSPEPEDMGPGDPDDIDYEHHMEFQDAPPPPPASPAVDHAPAPEVPVQDAPAALPGLWPQLVREYMEARPLVGSHLLKTSLAWTEGENPALTVTFLERSAFFLVGDDADFRKSVLAFLASKVRDKAPLQLRFYLDEAAPESANLPAPVADYGLEEIMRREPIVKTVLDLFDGRIIDGPARF